MFDRLRAWLGRWRRAARADADVAHPLLFADHTDIRDIAVQMARTKVELDRAVLSLRTWSRDLAQRFDDLDAPDGRSIGLRSLAETAGGLSHNLNNSLAVIIAYAELLLRDLSGDIVRHRVTVIRDVALEASGTVRRFQEFMSRQPHAGFGPVDLPAVIAEAIEMTAPRWRDEAERRGVVIAVRRPPDVVSPVEGNAFQLRNALVHLILNAVAALPSGGIITVRAYNEESGWIALEVRDTGVGMSEEVRRRALEGGQAGDAGRGLAEVADIAARHGGSLSIESGAETGTAVRLRLQASRFQIIPASEAAPSPVPADQAARILLVDDDVRLLGVLTDMLRAGGHEVTTAASGEDALKVFDPGRHEVVITDLGMPHVTGWEVAERVKSRSSDTAVFLLTGWGEGVAAGDASRFVDRVIAKPISADLLLAHLSGVRRRPPRVRSGWREGAEP